MPPRKSVSYQGITESILDWLLADPTRLSMFMAATGTDADSLRSGFASPEFRLAVLEFLLQDEGMLLAACRDLDLAPTAPMEAAAALGGGPAPHWT